jgi:hypothetical protein
MELATSISIWRSTNMMPQFRTRILSKSTKIDYRTAPRSTYEIPFLMKLGNLGYSEAADLISRHNGNRHEINAELIARRRKHA